MCLYIYHENHWGNKKNDVEKKAVKKMKKKILKKCCQKWWKNVEKNDEKTLKKMLKKVNICCTMQHIHTIECVEREIENWIWKLEINSHPYILCAAEGGGWVGGYCSLLCITPYVA